MKKRKVIIVAVVASVIAAAIGVTVYRNRH